MSLASSTLAATSADYIQKNAIVISGKELPRALLSAVHGKRLVLIGEYHGTHEFPAFVSKLLAEMARPDGKALALGVEFPADMQPLLDRFMATGDTRPLLKHPFFQDPSFSSGRGSTAMLNLLQTARSLKGVRVFCFDLSNPSSVGARDTLMAENVLSELQGHPSETVVTYSGNYHSRLVSGIPSNPDYKLMGAEILRLSNGALNLTNVTNLLLRFQQGMAWNCLSAEGGQPKCGVHSVSPIQSPYATATTLDSYYLREPEITEGHLNSVFIRSISASLPIQPVD